MNNIAKQQTSVCAYFTTFARWTNL